jgi:hypothetical protein
LPRWPDTRMGDRFSRTRGRNWRRRCGCRAGARPGAGRGRRRRCGCRVGPRLGAGRGRRRWSGCRAGTWPSAVTGWRRRTSGRVIPWVGDPLASTASRDRYVRFSSRPSAGGGRRRRCGCRAGAGLSAGIVRRCRSRRPFGPRLRLMPSQLLYRTRFGDAAGAGECTMALSGNV